MTAMTTTTELEPFSHGGHSGHSIFLLLLPRGKKEEERYDGQP
jgi:hypothetical protein